MDMPAIGPRTIELAVAARLAGIAVEAGGVLMLDRDETIRAADAHGCAIEGLARARCRSIAQRGVRLWCGARHGPRAPERARQDRHRQGLGGRRAARPFRHGSAVVVARAYILAFAAAESASAMLARVRALRQWGMRGKRRLGVLVCRADELADASALAALCEQAAAAGTVRHRCHRDAGGAGPLRGIAAARGRPRPVPGNVPAEQREVAAVADFRQQDLGARACGSDAFPRTATTSACS